MTEREWSKTASDEEIVQRFVDLHNPKRRSVHGARSAMLKLAPRLYAIMLDGLQSRRARAHGEDGRDKEG